MNLIKKLPDMVQSPEVFIDSKDEAAIYTNATHIIGVCFDGTASFRKGARLGPDAIREASDGIETYSPYLNDDTTNYNIIDCSNIPIYQDNWLKMNDYFHEQTKDLKLIDDKVKIVTLGGEHSISYGPIRLHLDQYENLVILHLDAHTDLRDGYLGEKYSHASIIRRVWNHMDESNELIQYGIRSGLKEEFDFMNKHKTQAQSLEELISRLEAIDNSRPIYLTLDLDFFDPAYLPGTGTPEAGGETFHSYIKLMKLLKTKNFVGADIVELAPDLDSTGNSSVFTAKVLRETILAIQ